MRRFAVVILLLGVTPAQAITWNFDTEGDTQGWVATEGNNPGAINAPRLTSEVRDGVWRITPLPPSQAVGAISPVVSLSSPVIGRDSALFDRLRLRLRVVYTRPFTANLMLLWRNSVNEDTGAPGGVPPRDPQSEYALLTFTKGVIGQVYTTDWQEVVVSPLRTEEFTYQQQSGGARLKGKQVWEGELFEISLRLFLNEMAAPGDLPEAVEIDWIQLTGVEEQIQGEEGQPPSASLPSFGELFAAPVFSPLRGGIASPYWVPMAALGDLDGDGHPDLLARWEDPDLSAGWLSAFNDGQGQFRTGRIEPLGQSLAVGGADLDGDGLMDLVLRDSAGLKVLHNRAEEGFVPAVLDPEAWYLGVGDAEGDGDADLWTLTYSVADDKVTGAVLQRNDGAAHFQPVPLGHDLAAQGFVPFVLARPVSQERTTGLIWVSVDDPGQGYRVTYLDGRGDWVQEHLAATGRPIMVRYAGDFDRDGDVDLVVSEKESNLGYTGVRILVNAGDGQLEPVTWDTTAVLANDVSFLDLNHDPWLDLVFVDTRLQGPAVVVALGQEYGLPVQEGRYPLQG
ncbi:MAG: VCBS repeat-containing protein, partial [Candidatus Latescibacterota bacterium]